MNRPTSAVAGRSMSTWAQRTRARAEARTKERHSCKPLRKQFRRDSFNYRQIAREGDIALYEQRWTGCPDPAACFEVILVRRREGFRIGRRFIEPAEVYPPSQRWGELGWTFCDKNAAFAKLRAITATTGGGT
jgi:hypothetical protein